MVIQITIGRTPMTADGNRLNIPIVNGSYNLESKVLNVSDGS
jgi:hypothetical protein